jgi:hypothetical protein
MSVHDRLGKDLRKHPARHLDGHFTFWICHSTDINKSFQNLFHFLKSFKRVQ